jgi:hypothetical protein
MTIDFILSMNGLTPYTMYSHLDSRSKGALKCTSKQLNSFISALNDRDYVAKEFANEVLKNFKIIYCSLPQDRLHTVFFHPLHIVGLGETHSKDFHRKLNSYVINSLYSPGYNLRVECSRSHLPEVRTGEDWQLKYVSAKIRSKTKSWDIPHQATIDLYIYSLHHIRFIQDILAALNGFEHDSLTDCIQVVKNHFPNDGYRKIFNSALAHYNRIMKPKLRDKVTAALEIVQEALFCLQDELYAIDQSFKEDCEARDTHLERVLQRDVLKQKRCSIFIAGSNHLTSLAARELIPSLYKTKGIPVLLLKSKSRKIVANESNSTPLNLAVSLCKKIESIPPSQFFRLKQRLIQLDLMIIDCDANHFGSWLFVCDKVIDHEIACLKKLWKCDGSAL